MIAEEIAPKRVIATEVQSAKFEISTQRNILYFSKLSSSYQSHFRIEPSDDLVLVGNHVSIDMLF